MYRSSLFNVRGNMKGQGRSETYRVRIAGCDAPLGLGP
jgi:hypothetical protein